jgi:hypothetical protein
VNSERGHLFSVYASGTRAPRRPRYGKHSFCTIVGLNESQPKAKRKVDKIWRPACVFPYKLGPFGHCGVARPADPSHSALHQQTLRGEGTIR